MDPPYTPVTTTNGNGNGAIPHDEPATAFDSSVFHTYLLSLLPPVLGASPADLESIFDDEFDERITRFASEGGGVIYVVKRKDEVEGESAPVLDRRRNPRAPQTTRLRRIPTISPHI